MCAKTRRIRASPHPTIRRLQKARALRRLMRRIVVLLTAAVPLKAERERLFTTICDN